MTEKKNVILIIKSILIATLLIWFLGWFWGLYTLIFLVSVIIVRDTQKDLIRDILSGDYEND